MGGGESRNVKFPSEALTNFTFPFAVTYKGSNDPGSAVFVDLGRKCGLVGDSRSNIIVNYKITVRSPFSLALTYETYRTFLAFFVAWYTLLDYHRLTSHRKHILVPLPTTNSSRRRGEWITGLLLNTSH